MTFQSNLFLQMDDAELIRLNALGLIPGPDEDEAKFLERSRFCLSLKDRIGDGQLPNDRLDATCDEMASGLKLADKEFGIKPTFVPVFFSNWRLMPWHGASAWIFQLTEDGPLGALLQLRKALHQKSRYLGLYDRDELVAHELAHAARMAFEEPRYEEILAYRTSKSGLAKLAGPILQSSFESRLFVYILLSLMLFDLYFSFTGDWNLYLAFMPLKAVPLLMALYGWIRLKGRKKRAELAEKRLAELYGLARAPHVLFRLTDDEIDFFAVASEEQFERYIAEQTSLRWRAIKLGMA